MISNNQFDIDTISIVGVAKHLHSHGPSKRITNCDGSHQLLHESYADEMRAGLWRLDSWMMIGDDRLGDGAHRCAAIIVVGRPVEIGLLYTDGPKDTWLKTVESVTPRRALRYLYAGHPAWFHGIRC